MDQTRREFLQTAAALTGSGFAWSALPASIERAFKIDPPENSTYRDAEHIVILMQENRSFDHCFGSLQGVRGFRDPRAHTFANGRRVWFQTDAQGKTYAPFRLDMKGSNVTWVGGLPHSWPDQVDARNGGHCDKWLIAKARKDRPYAMGFYTREDLPFYYAFADAFTVCDQAFCSSLTGTTPNRLHLWTGTIREDASRPARVQNGDTDYEDEASWTTFPERLERAGVSWHIYQNEVSIYSGLQGEHDSWLQNFTDNPIEWFSQYKVRFAKSRRRYIWQLIEEYPAKAALLEQSMEKESNQAAVEKIRKDLAALKTQVEAARKEQAEYSDAAWAKLDQFSKNLHTHAFGTNEADPDYRTLEELTYQDGGETRTLNVPKGDTLFQFRKDVTEGKLPAVSWIVAPENFSDHPSSAWFGAWYLSEVLNILTDNPEVWKKTIFILCYDENDGYYDHIPPFTAPHPNRPETGKCSPGLDTSLDWSTDHNRDNSIGLGYRCPLVVASPWTRGGCVNSEVFDHTSIIQLVESWLDGKGTQVRETNISPWRRTVCGDMTSMFRPYNGETYELPEYLVRNETIIGIHKAKFLEPMAGVSPLTREEIRTRNVGLAQEPGVRPSCPLPYELEVNASVKDGELHIKLMAGRNRFGDKSAGAPFNLFHYGETAIAKAYAVEAGQMVEDAFPVGDKDEVRVDGPNGFMRHFRGGTGSDVDITVETSNGRLSIHVVNRKDGAREARISDESYGAVDQRAMLPPGKDHVFTVDARANNGWYDFTVTLAGRRWRYAGRVETGKWSTTDPAMA